MFFLEYFWKGIIVGLSATIPLGPIGVLCIQRTLNKGRQSGFVSGIGAATADAFYAVLAGFGVSFIIDYLIKYQTGIRITGSLILIFLGYRLITTNPAIQLRKQLRKKRKGLFGDFISTFALTISNPITIIYFIGIFAGFNILGQQSNYFSVVALIIGVFSGALLWWFSLSTLINIFRNKFKLRKLLYINRITGIFIIGFAIFIIVSVFIDGIF